MAIVNAFSTEKLKACGFSIVRKEAIPQKITVTEIDVVEKNVFAMLENSKNLPAEFIEFEDQAWIIAKAASQYSLFGTLSGNPLTIDHSNGAIHVHETHNSDLIKVVNTSLERFICCFNYFQSFIVGARARFLFVKEVNDDRILNSIPIFKDSDEMCSAGLRALIETLDPEALTGDSFWGNILSDLDSDNLSYFIQPGFYVFYGRLIPWQ